MDRVVCMESSGQTQARYVFTLSISMVQQPFLLFVIVYTTNVGCVGGSKFGRSTLGSNIVLRMQAAKLQLFHP